MSCCHHMIEDTCDIQVYCHIPFYQYQYLETMTQNRWHPAFQVSILGYSDPELGRIRQHLASWHSVIPLVSIDVGQTCCHENLMWHSKAICALRYRDWLLNVVFIRNLEKRTVMHKFTYKPVLWHGTRTNFRSGINFEMLSQSKRSTAWTIWSVVLQAKPVSVIMK